MLSFALPIAALGYSARAHASVALPSGATLIAQVAIPGFAHVSAIEYRKAGTTTLRVVQTTGNRTTLRWQKALPAGTWNLSAPGLKGVIRGTTALATGRELFAYQYTGASVQSAIAGTTGGTVAGDIKLSLSAHGFVTVNSDAQHTGSVAYRTNTTYAWSGSQYVATSIRHFPDYPPGKGPRPNAIIHTKDGSVTLISLQVAATEVERELGLMYITKLDPDSGMVFVWTSPSTEGFWMQNTYVPLSIAFIDATGTIIDIQDMAALDTTIHSSPAPYLDAIEANQGYFAAHDIKVGDKVQLHLEP
jgi:uncharacterized membrane protein (UPF0127 family)